MPPALTVFGGTGDDTLQTSSFAFTASEREAIFFSSSIETIVDTEGTFHSDPNAIVLTEGADVLALTADDDTVKGNALTLNPGDDLDGGEGFDSLVLFGGGTFNLNALAGFANFEKVEVVNVSTTPVTLTLRDGTTSDVTLGGSTFTSQINLSGTASAGTIQGGAGRDTMTLSGNASATTILGGDGFDTVMLSGNASVTTIDVGNDSTFSGQLVRLADAASATIIQGGSSSDTVQLLSSGSANVTTINLGAQFDTIFVGSTSAWNPNIAIDAGTDSDQLVFSSSGQT
ncbi:hypothetical protein JQ575_36310, partial [Bradyrhizobium sp. JYMT SZCCT0428]|nr:hypothetical protein [Bradyrhizobium sp. JYMT SZCCT0428]